MNAIFLDRMSRELHEIWLPHYFSITYLQTDVDIVVFVKSFKACFFWEIHSTYLTHDTLDKEFLNSNSRLPCSRQCMGLKSKYNRIVYNFVNNFWKESFFFHYIWLILKEFLCLRTGRLKLSHLVNIYSVTVSLKCKQSD